MTWNYRVCKSTYTGEGFEEVNYEIHEVYYNPDGSIWATSQNATPVYAETEEGIKEVLEKMRVASEKEVIDLDKIAYVERQPRKETVEAIVAAKVGEVESIDLEDL